VPIAFPKENAMTHRTAIRSALALAVALLLSATAQAQLFRAYLAPTGSDANPCTLAAPCRLLPAALSAVADGGEIWMLDSANYNTTTVNIAKSVTILAIPGAVGSVVAAGGNAINISTGGVEVALRNLVIVPLPGAGATGGISMSAGAMLTVEDCLIANLPGSGIFLNTAAILRIADSTIRDNGTDGVRLQAGAAVIARTTISGNPGGAIIVYGTAPGLTAADVFASTLNSSGNCVFAYSDNAAAVVKVSVRDSQIARCSLSGLQARSDAGAIVSLSASNNVISNSGIGIYALSAGSRVWASGNTVSDNMAGLSNSSALFETAGNNAVRNNDINKSGTIAVIAPE
jgi:hypothetical protein